MKARPSRAVPRETRLCELCGSSFLAPRKDSRHCSPECSSRARRDSKTIVCSECPNPARARGLCSYHYKRAMYPDWRTSAGRAETRRRSLRTKTQERRARLRDPDAERIDRDEVGTRDGWLCGLCGEDVDHALPYPHPLSPSLDHVVPLARGGLHRMDNVQISHLRCNIAKGAQQKVSRGIDLGRETQR